MAMGIFKRINRKILLVDDEQYILDGLRRQLERRFEVVTALRGEEALLLLDARGPFAAVISDLKMPVMDGLEFLGEMRTRAPQTVRMVLSGSGDFNKAIAAVNEGAVFRFLTKPVPPDVLTEAIEAAILRYEMEKRLPGFSDPYADLLSDVRHLHQGISGDQLRLFLQPQCAMDDGRITGAEALVRWQHPNNGLLLPGQFFGTAEAGGLMGDITNWVLDATLREASHWKRQGMAPIPLAVNVNAQDLTGNGFPEKILEALERHGLTPDWLEIELTEGAAVQDLENTRACLEKLAAKGIKLSIDDFGTGYAQLGWLRHLPFTKLKIDRSFIMDIDTKPEAYRFLESMIVMASDSRMSILAEGVETSPQMAEAKRAGCELMQGFFLAKPMPTEDFFGWLGKKKS